MFAQQHIFTNHQPAIASFSRRQSLLASGPELRIEWGTRLDEARLVDG
jgi:hypothetical protein